MRMWKSTKLSLSKSDLFEFGFLRRLTPMQVDSVGRGRFSLPTRWNLPSLSNNSLN